MKKIIKRIVALGIGATFVGATLLGAAAAGLNQYPAPFIQNGRLSGVLVVGDNAAAQDVVGVSDVAMSLQYNAAIKIGETKQTATTVVEGDYFEFVKGSDKLDFNEQLRDVTSTLTKDDLDSLKDESFRAKSTEEFKQEIKVGQNAEVVFETYDDVDEDPQLYLKFAKNEEALSYTARFSTAARSDIGDKDELEDFENTKLYLIGREYTITDATKLDTTGNIQLELMGGAIQDTLEVGTEKTYDIDGKSYEVSIMVVSGDSSEDAVTKLIVNDEITKSLGEGDTYELNDGTVIGIKEVLPTRSGDVTQHLVEFYIGAKKVVLRNGGMDIDENTNIEGVDVELSTSISGDELKLQSIEITWTPSEDIYVGEGDTISDAIKLIDDEDAQLFISKMGVNYRFDGLDTATNAVETVKLEAESDDNIVMEFTNKNGDTYEVPIFYQDGSSFGLGEETNKNLYNDINDIVCDEEMFVVENDETTRVLQLTQVRDDYIKIKDLSTGDVNEYDRDGTLVDIHLDGDYQVNVTGTNCVTLLEIGSGDIYTQFGSKIELDTSSPHFLLEVEQDGTTETHSIDVSTGTEITFTSDFSNVLMQRLDSNDDLKQGITAWGTAFEKDENDQDSWTINIPEEQLEVNVLFTAGQISTSTVEPAEGETVILNKIDVGAVKLSSEVTGIETAQNLILVGGPCANPAVVTTSAEFPECSEDSWILEPGQALIKLVEQDNGNVALLIAGTTAQDTRRATKAVANGKLQELNENVKEIVLNEEGEFTDLPEVIVEEETEIVEVNETSI